MRMRWEDVHALHWRVPARRLARLVPAPLRLDLWEGQAWVSALALRAVATRAGRIPVGTQDYAQVNLRTYVRHGATPGIWLLGTFASAPDACAGARWLGLPYWDADVRVGPAEAAVGDGRGFSAAWTPQDDEPIGPLDRFLLDRFHLFSRVGSQLVRFDVAHPPWRLARAAAEVGGARLLPRRLRRQPPDLAHVAEPVEVVLRRPWRL